MVPQFRYLVFKAVDSSPEELVEHEEQKFDDNLLRQFQRLFGYLALTERQAADPTGFCFAFKDWEGNRLNVRIQEDANQFLLQLLDKLEDRLNPTSQKYTLQDIF